ncbi:MAG: glycosyltransferase [Opitutaceae bacterium]
MNPPSLPDISIVIPVYNRGELIRYTLESVRRASAGLTAETIVVDDGSEPPAAESIARLGFAPEKILRQSNQGLLFARLAGLAAATGRHVLFLDSDDLISREKLRLQVAAMEAVQADVSYTDTARCLLQGDYDALSITLDTPCPDTHDSAEFFISVQPAPHSPVFRTDYLRRTVAEAFFPPSPLYNPVAEIWFYHNAAPRPARVMKVPGPHTIIGQHPSSRLTNNWEKLGVGSLAVQEAFVRSCPDTAEAARVRELAAGKAFLSWRRLPRGFSPEFCTRQLAIWQRLHARVSLARLGGRGFQILAGVVGPIAAARWLRLIQGHPYERVRTMDDASFQRLLTTLPAPQPMATKSEAPPSLLVKFLKAGSRARRSRFHTARGDVLPLSAVLYLPATVWLMFLPRLMRWRPTRPWIPFSAVRAIARRLTPASMVLEVGSGMSTLWLARRCARLVSLEADELWFKRIGELLRRRGHRHVDLRYRWKADELCDFSEFPTASLDLVIVDGGPREQCLRAALPKVRPGGAVYVDNTDEPSISGQCREYLQETAGKTGGRLYYYRDFSPGNFFVSEGILLVTPGSSPQ